MDMKQLLVRLRNRLCAFRKARSGNVTTIFALAIIPIIGAVGAAVDYSHANSARTAMQAAVDATALMLSKNISTLSTAQINSQATSYFTALYTRPEVTNISVTPTYTSTDGTQLVVKASGTVKASFVSLIGVSQVTIGASSTIKWGNSRLRVALVLDNTGSMNDDGKITALKTATKNLLTQLQTAAVKDGDVYVSIIPFVKDVNVGSGNYNAQWIYWDDAAKSDVNSWDANNGTCSKSGYSPRSSCTSQGTCSISVNNSQNSCNSAGTCSISVNTDQSSCVSDGTCSKSNNNNNTKTKCTNNGNTWTAGVWTPATWTPAVWTPNAHSTWNGCVEDRGLSAAPSPGNFDTNVTVPTTTDIGTLLPAEQYSSCPQAAIMQLNYNWSAMSTLVTNMTANGNTNQGIGLQLGWMSLTGGGPFTVPTMDANYKYSQVIILLTDGLNTQNRWYTSETSIDTRQNITCNNIKAAGVTLYTVQVNTGGDPTSTLLQNCASDSSKFFLLKSATAMVTTFSTIGTQLSNLRVAK